MDSIVNDFATDYVEHEQKEYTIEEYLQLCKEDKSVYATAAERMLLAIGEPELINTADDERLSRIFQNRVIKRYPAFKEFYGMEDTVERIVAYFKHAAQGLEESKQMLYLLGPVGGGKSSLAERLKALMEVYPIYVLKDSKTGAICPNFETPLGLFNPDKYGARLEEEFGIAPRYLTGLIGPWTIKRLKEYGGDISQFRVVRLMPSKLEQIGIAKTEPGDENNQDISTLVGKVDIRQLEKYSQDDADAYSFSGSLCKANQGIMEFVEMFKAPIKVLHPLLSATQEGNYNGTEALPAIPFDGVLLAHSNESEWDTFKNNKKNEAFLDRIYIVKVPYCLRIDEEVEIYKKLLRKSDLFNAPCAPDTLEMMAQFAVLSRIHLPENSDPFDKVRIYNGENLKDTSPNAKAITEYLDDSGVNEGMDGLSTRFAFKVLSQVFNYDTEEIAANPLHLLFLLSKVIEQEEFQPELEERYQTYLDKYLKDRYMVFIGKEIQTAYLESYSDLGQTLFDRYILFADAWLDDNEYVDPNTGQRYDREALNTELEKIEKPAQIANPKPFRNEVVKFALRYRAKNDDKNPDWTAYEKLREVIEAKMFTSTEEILPIVSFDKKSNKDEQRKHDQFVDRMVERGYTERQVRLLVEWFLRVRSSS